MKTAVRIAAMTVGLMLLSPTVDAHPCPALLIPPPADLVAAVVPGSAPPAGADTIRWRYVGLDLTILDSMAPSVCLDLFEGVMMTFVFDHPCRVTIDKTKTWSGHGAGEYAGAELHIAMTDRVVLITLNAGTNGSFQIVTLTEGLYLLRELNPDTFHRTWGVGDRGTGIMRGDDL